jgi:hypothetical protein
MMQSKNKFEKHKATKPWVLAIRGDGGTETILSYHDDRFGAVTAAARYTADRGNHHNVVIRCVRKRAS